MGTFYRLSKTRRRTRSTGFFATGNTAAATFLRTSLEIRRRLIALDPGNTQYRLGLAGNAGALCPLFQVLGQPNLALKECANQWP